MQIVIEQDKAGITNDHAVLKGDGRDMVQLSCSEGTDDSDYNVGGDGGSGVDDDDNGGVGCYNGEGGSGDGDDGSGDKCGGISCDMYDGGNDHGDGGNNDNDSDNDDDSGGDGDNGSDDDGECFDGCGSVDIEYNDDHSDNGDRDGHIGYGDDVHDDGGHGDDHGDSDDHVDDHGDGDEHGDSDDHGDDHGDGGDHDDVHDDDDHGDDHDDGDDHGDYHGDGDDHGDYHGDSDDHATKGVGMVQQVSTVQKNKLPTSPLYLGAPISMKASWFACNYFARTNNLSDGATKQLLDLVAIHCIDKNNCAKSTYVLRKRLEIDVQSEIKKFCSQCFKEIKDTNNCICSQKKSTICYLIFLPFDKHMVNIFEGNM